MPEPDPVATTVAAWRSAVERCDATAAAGCMADDVEIISPLTASFRFHGREQAQAMLTAAFEVISDIRFHTAVGDATTRALFYHARCGAQPVEEAQLLRFDTDGEIVELTLFGRPLPALTEVMAGIGPAMLRRQSRPAVAAAIGAMSRPLAALTRLGERRVVPLADPARAPR